MDQNNELKLFEDKKIRAKWDEEKEKWYFSVVDVVAVLTYNDYQKSRNYWKTLKMRLNKEGSELVTNCYQLKMKSVDGKYYKTDVMNTEQVLRLIQSIPSKKAEPFKLWLAQVGKERIDEAYDPEIAINRALDIYRKKGYSEEWINQRLKTIDIRKEFTDELKEKGFMEAQDSVIEGENIARVAREQLERKTGKKVISDKNAKEIRNLNSGKE